MAVNCDPPIGSVPAPVSPLPVAASKPKIVHKPLAAALKPIDPDAVHVIAQPPKPKPAVHSLSKKYVPVRMPEGEVVGVYGHAVIRPLHGKVHPIKVGEIVHKGDVILTSQDGIVEIRHGDAVTKVECRDDSPLQFDAPGAGFGESADGGLQQGGFVDRVIEVVDANDFNKSFDPAATHPPGGVIVPGAIISTLPFVPAPAPSPSPAPSPEPAAPSAVVQIQGPAEVVEGQVAKGYTVTLDKAPASDVTVQLAYSGVAEDGSDYTGVATVTIPAGQTSVSFDIATLDDAIEEGDEAFIVTVVQATGGGFTAVSVDATADHVTTVIHDDAGPSAPPPAPPPPGEPPAPPPPPAGPEDTCQVSISGPPMVQEGALAVGYTVTLEKPALTDVTVQLLYSGVATDGSDYSSVAVITIQAGQTSASFDITTFADAEVEGEEPFTISLGTITGGGFEVIAANPAADAVETLIYDSPIVQISGPTEVVEGQVASGYTVSIDHAPTTDLTVQLTYSGTATDGQDYTSTASVVIKAGETRATFDIATADDCYVEGDEAFTVTIDSVSNGGFPSVSIDPGANHVDTVIHDDAGPGAPPPAPPAGPEDICNVSISGPSTVQEGQTAPGYTVRLDKVPLTDVTVKLVYTGTAADGSDYTGVAEVLVKAGEQTAAFEIPTLADQLVEGDEPFMVSVGDITGGGFEAVAADPVNGSVTTTIVDATVVTPTSLLLQISGPAEVTEGQVAAGYTLTLDKPATSDVTVTLTYSGVAADGSDYTGVASMLIPAGATRASFDIATLDDALTEGDEAFTVAVTQVSAVGADLVNIDATADRVTTVIHDDTGPAAPPPAPPPPGEPPAPPPSPGPEDTCTVSIRGPGEVVEGETAAGYTITLDKPAVTDVTLQLGYSGTAEDGTDFTGVAVVVIKAGATSATFDIKTLDDCYVEGDETFTVTLAQAAGGGFENLVIDPNAKQVSTVIHDDTGPGAPPLDPQDVCTVSISGPGSVVEGQTATGYTVTLDKPPLSDVTVQLVYTGTATDGSDYTAVTSVLIKAGERSAVFELPTRSDAEVEGNESVVISVGELTGGGFESIAIDPSAASVTTTIVDATVPGGTSALVEISGPAEVTEGAVASGYTVSIDKAPSTDVTVSLSYSGVAQDGSDYTGVASVVIKAGETRASFDISTLDDALAEGDEAYTVTVTQVSGGGFDNLGVDSTADRVTTVIHDDSGPSAPPPAPPPPGEPPAPPPAPGPEDTCHVSIAGPGSVVEGQTASGYTVTLDKTPASDVTIQLVYSGTAADGSDYTGVTEVVVKAGQTSASFDLPTLPDALVEGDERIVVSLGDISGGSFEALAVNPGAASVTTTIVDATVVPPNSLLLQISGPSEVTEGQVASGYTVTLDQAPSADVTVSLSYSGVALDGSDYTGVASVVIPAGATSATFDISTLDDALAEGDEAFTVTVTQVSSAGSDRVNIDANADRVTTVIHDDTGPVAPPPPPAPEPPPPPPGPEDTCHVSIQGPGSVIEGQVAKGYVVTLDKAPTSDVTVELAYGGVAKDDIDFRGVTSVVIKAGETSASFDIKTVNDCYVEGDEVFTVTLATASGGGFENLGIDPAASSVNTVIHDNAGPAAPPPPAPEPPPPLTPEDICTVAIQGPGSVVEGQTASGYQIMLTQPPLTDVTVKLAYSGTALDGSDFTGVAEVVIKAGELSASFDLPTLADELVEGNESIVISVGEITGGGFEAVAVDPTAATVTTEIVDATTPPPNSLQLQISGPADVMEGQVSTGYTLTLDKAPTEDVTVSLSYAGVAQDGKDYTGVAAVVIKAGQTSATFDIATIDDPLLEGDEEFTVSVVQVVAGASDLVSVDPSANSVTTVIHEPGAPPPNEAVVSITGPGEVVEGQVAAGYSVVIDKAPATDVTVQLSYSGVAQDGSDFTGVASVVIKAGETTAVFDLATLDDAYAEGDEALTVTVAQVSGGGFDALNIDATADHVTTVIHDDAGPSAPPPAPPPPGEPPAPAPQPGPEDTCQVRISGPGEVLEGEVARGYNVVLDKPAATDMTVQLSYSGTAQDGSDFTAVTSVLIPAGQTQVSFDLSTLGDADLEGSEVIHVALGAISGGGFEAVAIDPSAGSVNTTIVDATVPPPNDAVISITGPGEVVEGQVAAGYCVQIDKAPATDVTVNLSYSGVAQDGSDFTGVASVVIKAGETTAVFDLATLDDAYAEGDEALTVTVAQVSGGGFDALAIDATADHVTTVIHDDAGPSAPPPAPPPPGEPPAPAPQPGPEDTCQVRISGPGEVLEGEVARGYNVVLDKPAATDMTVQLSYSGTAQDGSDFTAVTSVLIPAGQTQVSFDLSTLGDADLEGSEVIHVALGAISGGGFEAVAIDPSAGSVNTTLVDATVPPPPPAPPEIGGQLAARVSEEDLPQGGKDEVGAQAGDDTRDSHVFEGQLTFTDPDSTQLTVTLSAPTEAVTSGGSPIVWTGEGTQALVGHVGSESGPAAICITIDDQGAYSVSLNLPVDHPAAGEDLLSLGVGVQVSDGVNISQATLTVGVEDDAPVASHSAATLLVDVNAIRIHDLDAGFSHDTYANGTRQVGHDQLDQTDSAVDGLRWGTPAACEGEQSGYTLVDNTAITSAMGEVVEAGQVFKLADFTHENFAIKSGSSALTGTDIDVTLQVDINGVTTPVCFTAHLVHTETPNSGGAAASRDIIQLPQQMVTVQVDGQDYQVNLLGFKDAAGNLVTEIRTDEAASNTYGLYGSVSSTDPLPQLSGQVDAEFGADGAGSIAWDAASSEHGSFVGHADGSYTFVMNRETRDSLDAGERVTETITYRVTDADGDVTVSTLDIVLGGQEPGAPPPPPPANDAVLSVTGPDSATEGQGPCTYVVHLDKAPTSDVTVQLSWAVTDKDDVDSSGVSSITIKAGETSASFEIATLDDAYAAEGVNFTVAVTGATGGGFDHLNVDPLNFSVSTDVRDDVGPNAATPDAPAGPEDTAHISLSGPDEVEEGQVASGYTVTLDKEAATDMVVELRYGGTATDGSDYTSVAHVTIKAGESSATFDLPTRDDAAPGPVVSTVLYADNFQGGGNIDWRDIGTGDKCHVEIGKLGTYRNGSNSDGVLEVEGYRTFNAQHDAGVFTDISVGTAQKLTLELDVGQRTKGDSACSPGTHEDFAKQAFDVYVNGQLVKTIVPTADMVHQTVELDVHAGANRIEFRAQDHTGGALGAILDNVKISGHEGGAPVDNPAEGPEQIVVSIGAVDGGGFEAVQVTPNAFCVTTTILDDAGVPPAPPPAPVPSPEPVLAHVGLSGAASVVEGQTARDYTVTLDKVPTADVTVRFAYSGTATNGVDFKGVASIVIPAGKTSASFDLATLDDCCKECSETVKVEIATASGGGFDKLAVDTAHATVVTTLVDNDGFHATDPAPIHIPVPAPGPVVSLTGPGSVVEGQVAKGYCIKLSCASSTDTVVKLCYSGTASDGSDYTRVADVTIPAGKTVLSFNLSTTDDARAEGKESISLSLGDVSGGATVSPSAHSVTTTIVDNDAVCAPPPPPPAPEACHATLSLTGPASVNEGDVASGYKISLSQAAQKDVVVKLVYSGTAQDGADYERSVDVTIPAGKSAVKFAITTKEDALNEGHESIDLRVGEVQGGGFDSLTVNAKASSVCTRILDDDASCRPGAAIDGGEHGGLLGSLGGHLAGVISLKFGEAAHDGDGRPASGGDKADASDSGLVKLGDDLCFDLHDLVGGHDITGLDGLLGKGDDCAPKGSASLPKTGASDGCKPDDALAHATVNLQFGGACAADSPVLGDLLKHERSVTEAGGG